jgi:hypothetical protein
MFQKTIIFKKLKISYKMSKFSFLTSEIVKRINLWLYPNGTKSHILKYILHDILYDQMNRGRLQYAPIKQRGSYRQCETKNRMTPSPNSLHWRSKTVG